MARESKFTTDDLYDKTRSLLFQYGYDSFHFGLLAEQLGVTRSALYKYFRNKDELITEFMLFEMNQFLSELERIDEYNHFEEQLDFLLKLIFKYSKIHQILLMIYRIPNSNHEKVLVNIQKLEEQHGHMYTYLNQFVKLGRKEKKLKPYLPDEMILGLIFQTVNIPNHSNIPDDEWRELIKESLLQGIARI